MNHQERLELLGALSRAGVSYYKSHDLEVRFGSGGSGLGTVEPTQQPTSQHRLPAAAPIQDDAATEKLKGLIETLKMDDASLLDKIFPAGAGG